MGDPEVARSLKLTETQQGYVKVYFAKLTEARESANRAFMGMVAPGRAVHVDSGIPGPGPMKFAKSMQEMRREIQIAREKAEQVRVEMAGRALRMLSPEQLQRWQILQGSAFSFKQPKQIQSTLRGNKTEPGNQQ